MRTSERPIERPSSGMKSRLIALAGLLACLLTALVAAPALSQGLAPGSYHWYVPEHETHGRTSFYSQQSFQSSLVRVIRTQRFKVVAGGYGWILLEFDVAGKAYIHVRVLRNLMYDPSASDPWYEFRRASVFSEEPAKLEARLKAPPTATPAPSAVDSKTPAWKRYKDGWGLRPSRPGPAGSSEEASAETAQSPARPYTINPSGKPRSKYPLLPPIGSEPPQDPAAGETPESGSETPAPR